MSNFNFTAEVLYEDNEHTCFQVTGLQLELEDRKTTNMTELVQAGRLYFSLEQLKEAIVAAIRLRVTIKLEEERWD